MIFAFAFFSSLVFSHTACDERYTHAPVDNGAAVTKNAAFHEVNLIVLGTVQDAGSPHIACQKDCCKDLFNSPNPGRKVVSLGLVDSKNESKFLFDATPDMTTQLKDLKSFAPGDAKEVPDAVFLTHAHIGHYTGLMYFGKEAMGADSVPVYAMPRMTDFLKNNGPWDQLVTNGNIALRTLAHQQEVQLTDQISIRPFLVPHRAEYSETVGYTIIGPNKKALFIPDIDKWEKWEKSIIEVISQVDYAFLDATFFDAEEINYRDISQIPHPFVIESMERFKNLPVSEKGKIYFIHLNHTNPLLNAESTQSAIVKEKGFHIAHIYDTFGL